jgi:hypothetical protein
MLLRDTIKHEMPQQVAESGLPDSFGVAIFKPGAEFAESFLGARACPPICQQIEQILLPSQVK